MRKLITLHTHLPETYVAVNADIIVYRGVEVGVHPTIAFDGWTVSSVLCGHVITSDQSKLEAIYLAKQRIKTHPNIHTLLSQFDPLPAPAQVVSWDYYSPQNRPEMVSTLENGEHESLNFP